ncbi:MAG: cation:proton antiporter [Phycisphaerae bacterium]
METVSLFVAAAPVHHLLTDIGIAVIAATVIGLAAHWLRQPILLGYIIAGALIGPIGFKWIQGEHSIETISEIGLVLLLFIIGLELNIGQILRAGKQLLVSGFGQFPLCALIGAGLFALFGYGLTGSNSSGLYYALVCSLSSTAIVVKLLYDKKELDTLPGRLTLGILVIQDIFAIFVLAFQPNFANPTVGPIVKAVLGSAGLVVGVLLVSKYVLRRVFTSIATNPEMVLAVSIGWCAVVAAAANAMGLSKEMGALVAGLSIAAFPYSIHVTAKTLPLRDFFMTLFFVSLGMKITAPTAAMVGPVVLVTAFAIVSRFVTIFPLIALTGGGKRAAFVTSLNLAQISEFSLVIAALGVKFGHITEETVAVILYAMALTAVLSSYGIRYSHPLFKAFDKLTTRKGAPAAHGGEDEGGGKFAPDVVLLGYHRMARAYVDGLERTDPAALGKLLVIDFNPVTLDELKSRGVRGMFGDIASMETLEHAHISHAKAILSTIPDLLLKGVDNVTLVKMCRAIAPHARIIATADDAGHEGRLRREGADGAVRLYEAAAGDLGGLIAPEAEAVREHRPHTMAIAV